MGAMGQIRAAAAVALVLGAFFGAGDLIRVSFVHTGYIREPVLLALWVAKAVGLGAAFALVVTIPPTLLFMALRPGDRSAGRVRRVAAGAWILVHVFLILLWQDYKSLEQELGLARMAAKAGFLMISGLTAWGLSGLAAWFSGAFLGALRPRRVALLLLVAAAAFLTARWRVEGAAGPPRTAAGPNVLFILVDTLRADALGSYGYNRDTSPHIDAFARQSVLFEEAIAQSSWTIPTVASIFTGVYPEVHRVLNYEGVLSEKFLTLAEVFQAAGYRTAARISNILVSEAHGYHQGFDDAYVVMDLSQRLFLEKLLAQARITRHYDSATANEITDAGLAWLKRHGNEPFFLYLHYYDPHYPYYPPPDYAMRYVEPEMAKRYPYRAFLGNTIWNIVSEYKVGGRGSPEAIAYNKAAYDAEINFADDQIARILDYLEDTGLTDDTIVVFTSDHGEQFYEHGQRLHSKTLYNEEIHVPLIIRVPGGTPRRVAERVEGLDLYRTLLSLANIPGRSGVSGIAAEIENQAMGASLVPLMNGESLSEGLPEGLPEGLKDAVYSSLDMDSVTKEAYFEGEWKLIQNIVRGDDLERPPLELYHLAEDPGERNELASRETERRDRLTARETKGRTAITARAVSEVERKPLSESEIEKLKALGYINQ